MLRDAGRVKCRAYEWVFSNQNALFASSTDIFHIPDSKWQSYPNGPLDSTENGLRRRRPRPFARSIVPILQLTPPKQWGRAVSAQRQRLPPKSPTFSPFVGFSHLESTLNRAMDRIPVSCGR
jgi:hypothetical protein